MTDQEKLVAVQKLYSMLSADVSLCTNMLKRDGSPVRLEAAEMLLQRMGQLNDILFPVERLNVAGNAVGHSSTVAAAKSLQRLLESEQSVAKLRSLIDAGLNDDKAVHHQLVDQLKIIAKNSKGDTRKAAEFAVSKAESCLLDSDAEIQQIGMAEITWVGAENVYLDKDGAAYYFKPANNERFSLGLHDFSKEVVFGC